MNKLKVLYVCHNHPAIRSGGAEAYAFELYEAMRASDKVEPIFLGRIGSDAATPRRPHPGTPVSTINDDSNQYVFFQESADFDFFYLTAHDKDIYTKHFHRFLLAHQPDLIHFQHTHFLGYDVIRQARNSLPDVPIVYTLHEYLPICHRDGQMLRTNNQERCLEASPRRCHECFPQIAPQDFFLRKRFIQSHFSLVDLFLSPSHFLRERYIAWGIPADKIRFEDNGRRTARPVKQTTDDRPRNRIAFFGQFNFYKGVLVLLKAMQQLSDEAAITGDSKAETPQRAAGAPHLWLHGANLELQPEAFQHQFRELLAASQSQVTLVGRYDHAELAALMANIDWVMVPSIWWENAPLVIQEAFAHGRPVICSDIGGMAEKVSDGVNGLHFRAGDARSLAQTIRRAVETPGLWDQLRRGIPQVYTMAEHAASLIDIYQSLGARASYQR
jgi:glycosyltransferase involved in cell wall biosynthesis